MSSGSWDWEGPCPGRSNASWVIVTWGRPVKKQTPVKILPFCNFAGGPLQDYRIEEIIYFCVIISSMLINNNYFIPMRIKVNLLLWQLFEDLLAE